MKLSLLKIATLSALTISASAFAADPVTVNGGTVHFTGELVNAACAVSTESSNQTVDLGQYRIARLEVSGDKTTPVPFQIKLVDCDPTVQATAAVAFYGQAESTNPNLLSVSAGGSNSTAASFVGIELSDDTSKILGINGSSFSTPKTLIAGDNTLQFSARYVATGKSTPGQANADATFVVKYE
ncbi:MULTISPECIES: type 1 fimbrial major subunit FimA [Acinetobacter]|uniref:Type 1 fimbrial major subunit FimA n=1 Tax=Acinetobacter bereziniae TaxID=106648 RepID=A0A0A8TQ18_ACIBZ|nr:MULTISPECIES: type 1 fimbrial major subunit FimA [Acinetobacter]ELW78374.1 type-1 fimbrial protein, A chain [Acinetobacter sp. WC-743]MBI0394535.1 type 1 fimbrial major subunit FimA [Acinetobacter bereziniae]MBJ8423733.1 type 1 fimbrial major subunit FimA [Acinetobacter bereziniae]MBJ8425244.1 type 1 fimbrial major subunit FimA [Acinetobacter bereziniae]MBJ8475765.1 type 1 fimbrial major subunit FimA [Acinetobacter bereziniae]